MAEQLDLMLQGLRSSKAFYYASSKFICMFVKKEQLQEMTVK